MNPTGLIQEISAKEADIDVFVQIAIREDQARDEIVNQMLTHPDIMVYYHCYYVVSKASQERPELFYKYWNEMVSLLRHPNSYHRDFGLTILANLTRVDQDNLFPAIFRDYFEHVNDDRFMTAQCCVRNSLKIIRHRPELKDRIIDLLLDVDHRCAYPEKQKELLKSDILVILDEIYDDVRDKPGAGEFIKKATRSISPKTRNMAKSLVQKYGPQPERG